MGNSVYLSATDPAANRPAAVEAFLGFCHGSCDRAGGQPGYFKTVAADPEKSEDRKSVV
jgi:hypothetical protein